MEVSRPREAHAWSNEDVASAVEQLAGRATETAEAITRFAEEQSAKWKMRLENGKELTDETIGVSKRPHPSDAESVVITWRADPKDSPSDVYTDVYTTFQVELWKTHYDDLYARYYQAGHEQHLFLTRVFVMVTRCVPTRDG